MSPEFSKVNVVDTKPEASPSSNRSFDALLTLLLILPLLPIVTILLLLRVLREEFPIGFISGWYLDSDFLGKTRKNSIDSIINVWSPALSLSERGLPLYELAFEIECGATVIS